MIRKLMALPCLLALVLACGQGRTDGQDTGAAAARARSRAPCRRTPATRAAGSKTRTAAPSADVVARLPTAPAVARPAASRST